jgi:hypothetical protein
MEWPSASTFAIIVIIILLSLYAARYFYYGKSTVPVPSYKSGFTVTKEGFTIPTGTSKEGLVDYLTVDKAQNCLVKNPTASSILDMFPKSENSDDHYELTQLLNKLACFKKDISAPTHVVASTLKQPYLTAHDIEPIAETTARCFAKTISPRDLDISFDTWTERGNLLIERLGTGSSLSSYQVNSAQSVFNLFIRDIRNEATVECFAKEAILNGKPGPRDPHPYENPNENELGPYNGYY